MSTILKRLLIQNNTKMTAEADEFLRSKGIKPSFQRMRIFQYLQTDKSHPTVDTIYKNLQKEISTLSKTTVYNTLKQFAEKKIVQVVSMGDNESRYDLFHNNIGHFKCTKCNTIYDFEITPHRVESKELEGFHIEETQVCLKGICKNCKTN